MTSLPQTYRLLLDAIRHGTGSNEDNDRITCAAANLAAQLAQNPGKNVFGRFNHSPEVIFSTVLILRDYGVKIYRKTIRRRAENARRPDGVVVIWGEGA